MKQSLVSFTEKQLEELRVAALALNKSRAELLREAAEAYIANLAEEPTLISISKLLDTITKKLTSLEKELAALKESLPLSIKAAKELPF